MERISDKDSIFPKMKNKPKKWLYSNHYKLKEYSLEWAEFVFKNRSNRSDTPAHDYDIVYGPIADDKVGVQIRNFMEGNINIDIFLERLKYIKGVTFQYFFGTEKAIKHLKKL